MIERQVFVTWYKPDEKLPEDDRFVVVTISGKSKNIIYDHALTTGQFFYGECWLIEGIDPEESDVNIIVNAWCDLEPYEGD